MRTLLFAVVMVFAGSAHAGLITYSDFNDTTSSTYGVTQTITDSHAKTSFNWLSIELTLNQTLDDLLTTYSDYTLATSSQFLSMMGDFFTSDVLSQTGIDTTKSNRRGCSATRGCYQTSLEWRSLFLPNHATMEEPDSREAMAYYDTGATHSNGVGLWGLGGTYVRPDLSYIYDGIFTGTTSNDTDQVKNYGFYLVSGPTVEILPQPMSMFSRSSEPVSMFSQSVSTSNVTGQVGVSEPQTLLLFMGCIGLVLMRRRQ